MSLPTTLPQSPLFNIKDTPNAGRGVFAAKTLKSGAHLLISSVLPASVILRKYKREVCAQCFHYESGRKLKIRSQPTGFAFCSTACQELWVTDTGKEGRKAWEAVEYFVVTKNKSHGSNSNKFDALPDADDNRPDADMIRGRWEEVEGTAHFIRQARAGSKMKPHQRAVQAVLSVLPNTDILEFQLSGVLARANDPPTDWESLMEVVPDDTPFPSMQALKDHVQAYLHLLALLPPSLLPFATVRGCLDLVERDSHNSFGIRSLDDNGAEFFGYGVWPEASFFNHSCRPNVSKRRAGRAWEFWTNCDVRAGDELCISYLGGEEDEMGLTERRGRTMGTWGFECACVRCVEDARCGESEVESMDEG